MFGLVWLMIWLFGVAGYLWVLRRKRYERQWQRGQLVLKEESENGLFGLANFDSEESDSSDLEGWKSCEYKNLGKSITAKYTRMRS